MRLRFRLYWGCSGRGGPQKNRYLRRWPNHGPCCGLRLRASLPLELALRNAKKVTKTRISSVSQPVIGRLPRHCRRRCLRGIDAIGGASPWGTLAANLVGCLAIGLLAGYVIAGGAIDQRHHLAIRTGVLGSLTTFSTFALESVQLAGEQRWVTATAYLVANLFVGLLLVGVGMVVGR